MLCLLSMFFSAVVAGAGEFELSSMMRSFVLAKTVGTKDDAASRPRLLSVVKTLKSVRTLWLMEDEFVDRFAERDVVSNALGKASRNLELYAKPELAGRLLSLEEVCELRPR